MPVRRVLGGDPGLQRLAPPRPAKGKSVREGVVLRAVLSADRAAVVQWDRLTPSDLPGVVDTWWMQGAFANVDAAPPVIKTGIFSYVRPAAPLKGRYGWKETSRATLSVRPTS